MRKHANSLRPWLTALAMVTLVACADSEPSMQSGDYNYGSASRDGIGKFYMGREISHVMGHLGAGWLERNSRQREERTDLLLSNLPIEPDSTVVDLGAGTGYFSLPMAKRAPDGRVLAVDIQPEMLAIIESRSDEANVDNIELVLATEMDPNLPESEVDLVLIVDAYHEFSHPREVMQAIARSLRKDGRVYLIEYRGEDPDVPIKRLHKMTQKQAKKELAAAGLEWIETLGFLPQQHVLVFGRAD
ncbi:MAG: class I SAM-dependent methyltransferase [Gammaproteobacteria bacterium]